MGIMEIVLPAVVCFAITAVVGRLLIPALRRLKAGQAIKEIGPSWHMTKQGTPTMGGLMFIIGIGITVSGAWAGGTCWPVTSAHLYVYVFALVFGAIGFIDDYQKVKHHQNDRPDRAAEVHSAAGGGGGVPVPDAVRGHAEPQPVYSLL